MHKVVNVQCVEKRCTKGVPKYRLCQADHTYHVAFVSINDEKLVASGGKKHPFFATAG